jgi:hypothetical protein
MVNPSGGDPGWVKIFFGKGASPAMVIAVGNADPTSAIAIAESKSFVISGSSPVVMFIQSTRKLRARPRGHANASPNDERGAQERVEHNVGLGEATEDSAAALESAEPAFDFVEAKPGLLDWIYGSNRTGHAAPSEYWALARASRLPSDPLPDSPRVSHQWFRIVRW